MTRTHITYIALALSQGLSFAQEEDSMIYIPPGEFVMGTTKAEARRLATENGVHPTLFLGECPRRKVHVPGFCIDRFPVTNADYKKFIEATGQRAPASWRGGNFPKGRDDYPVTNIPWAAAAAYAKWVGKRLSTEAEWEKAARGTDGRIYPWGNEWDETACLIDDGTSPQMRDRTTPVGCFVRGTSPYGVMDMAGNVAEWTSTEASTARKDWWYVVKGAANAHVMKFNFRCASRAFSAHKSRRHPWLGFRCAKDAPQPPARVGAPEPATPRARPEFPKHKPPDEAEYGRKPIKIIAKAGHFARFVVPYFPDATFGLNVPEQAGAAGLPFAWKLGKPPVRWQVSPDGTSAEYDCTWQDVAAMKVSLRSGLDCVDFSIAIRNLSAKPFRGVGTNCCLNNSGAVYFIDPERTRTMVWTDDGPVRLLEMPVALRGEILHGGWRVARPGERAPKGGSVVRHPFIFLVSRDGRWIVAQAYGKSTTVATNAHYSCLHSRPTWPDIPPGEERSVTGKLYFLKGGPKELLERWQEDFGVDEGK